MKTFSQSIKAVFQHLKFRILPSKKPYVSEFGQLGDLKNLTLSELKQNFDSMKIVILDKNDEFIKVQIDDTLTKYILIFNANGKFHHIQEEYWKDLDVKFEHRKLSNI